MNAIPFDTLKLAQDLRDNAGMSQVHAEGMVRALAAAFDGGVATKADIAELRSEMDARFAKVDLRFAKIEADLVALEQRLTIKLGGMMVVAVGAVATLVKLL